MGYKMRGFGGFGNSPLKKNIKPKTGESYPKYLKRAFSESKDPYGQDVLDKKGYKAKYPKAKTNMATDWNYENKKAKNQKFLPDKHLKKKVRKKAIKKVVGKIASRAIPGVGWALAASDIYGVGKKMYKGASLKDAAKEQFLGIKSKNK